MTIRVGSWNILGRRNYRQERSADSGAIAAALLPYQLDVLCLQEVHFFGDSPEQQVVDEVKAAGLVHLVGEPLSPSHLDGKASLGLVIASRFPLTGKRTHRLHNPHVSALVRGKRWLLHDKGLIGVTLELGVEAGCTSARCTSFPSLNSVSRKTIATSERCGVSSGPTWTGGGRAPARARRRLQP